MMWGDRGRAVWIKEVLRRMWCDHDKIIGGQKSLVALAASRPGFADSLWKGESKKSPHALRTVVYQQYKSRLKKHSTQTDRHKKEPTKDLGTDVSILSLRQ